MKMSRKVLTLAAFAFVVSMLGLVAPPPAEAVVGAPLTPVSVAGVARRTTRRTAVVVASSTTAAANSQAAASQNQAAASQAAAQSAQASAAAAEAAAASSAAAAAAAAPAAASIVASLPDGCVPAGDVFNCGGLAYKPMMQGTTVVYALLQ